MTHKVTHLLGIAGVEGNERNLAITWAKRLEWPVLLVALWIPVQWFMEETHIVNLATARWFDWAIWLVFLIETTILTSLVRNKKRYLLTNWMNLVIILAGIPIEWTYTPLVGALRNLRLLLMMFLLVRLSDRIRSYLERGHIGVIMIITGIVVALAGVIISLLEPSIGSIWDGMWYAWVTITHTGYGDIVPKTTAGRFFGGLLIFLGVVLLTMFTASLSAFLIGGERGQTTRGTRKTDKLSEANVNEVMARLDRIERLLEERKN